MNQNGVTRRPSSGRDALAAAGFGFALAAGLALLALRRPPDGREHGAWAPFLGRFHPLLVHAPIVLVALVPVLEIAGLRPRWSHWRAPVGFILGLGAASALAAAADGWLLAWGDGYGGPLVLRHLWLGLAFAGASLLTAGVRAAARIGDPAKSVPRPKIAALAYPPLLLLTLALMIWASHNGGSVSHGENFLTERMPAALRTRLGLPQPRKGAGSAAPVAAGKASSPVASGAFALPTPAHAADPRLYGERIQPLFDRSCVSCHRAAKHKGDLRMDSYAELMEGGEDGPAVEPGHPADSELLRRVKLPPDDDDYMPSNGKKPLSPDEIRLLELWISAGAKP